MGSPLYPSLTPSYLDSAWFAVDKAVDEDAQLSALEKEHNSWLHDIQNRDHDLAPAGQVNAVFF